MRGGLVKVRMAMPSGSTSTGTSGGGGMTRLTRWSCSAAEADVEVGAERAR